MNCWINKYVYKRREMREWKRMVEVGRRLVRSIIFHVKFIELHNVYNLHDISVPRTLYCIIENVVRDQTIN